MTLPARLAPRSGGRLRHGEARFIRVPLPDSLSGRNRRGERESYLSLLEEDWNVQTRSPIGGRGRQRIHVVVILMLFVSIPFSAPGESAPATSEGETDDLTAWLATDIIGPKLTMTQTQDYLETRVPVLPTFGSAEAWTRYVENLRKRILDEVVLRGEARRWARAEGRVEWLETLPGGDGYHLKKLRFEALPGMWIPAVLYEPDELTGPTPVVLNVNGHDRRGKALPFKQIRCLNQVKRGMIALNVEWLGMGQLATSGYDHARMNQLDLCGTSGIAPFYLSLKRSLDLLLSLPHADPNRVAVTGLSGGGWQTIFISALDPRVKLAVPVAGYSSFRTRARYFKDLGDSEQTPCDLATVADYTHLTAMTAPRPLLLTYNSKDDCCFESGYALPPLLEAAAPVYALFHRDTYLRTHVNDDPGTHNYELDNRVALYRMLGEFFFGGDESYSAEEIPCEDEILEPDELGVPLPQLNEDFHTLALRLAQALPRAGKLPAHKTAVRPWQDRKRRELRDLLRMNDRPVTATPAATKTYTGVRVTRWRLDMAGAWTVPAVELTRGTPTGTTIVLADGGRQSAADKIEMLLDGGQRVVAVDLFYFGESFPPERSYLFPLFLSGVGERPLGVQAGELSAVARWVARHTNQRPAVSAVGPRTSLIALVTAAVDDTLLRVELSGSLGSLKQVIEDNLTVREVPEYFCFGLLEAVDIRQLAALVAPRPVTFLVPSARVRAELADLAAWYRRLGVKHDPFPDVTKPTGA